MRGLGRVAEDPFSMAAPFWPDLWNPSSNVLAFDLLEPHHTHCPCSWHHGPFPVLLLVFALPAQPWVSPLRGTQYCEYQSPSIRYVYSTQHFLFSYKTAPKHKPATVSGVQVSQTRRKIGCTDITEDDLVMQHVHNFRDFQG